MKHTLLTVVLHAATAREYSIQFDSSLPAHVRRPDLYEPIDPLHKQNYDPNASTALEAGLKPILKEFQQNIYWDAPYSETAVYSYLQAFYVGFQFSKYSNGQNCFTTSTSALDTLYGFNMAMIQRYTWWDPAYYLSQQIATDIDDAWYDCYLFGTDFIDTFQTKRKNFVDLPDFYLSFIFNLLGNSFQLKTSIEAMMTASATHDSVTFFQQLGSMLYLMYNFSSYKTTTGSLLTHAL